MGKCAAVSQVNYLIASAIMNKTASSPSAARRGFRCELEMPGPSELNFGDIVNCIKDTLGLTTTKCSSIKSTGEVSLKRKINCCICHSRPLPPQCPRCDFKNCSSACVDKHRLFFDDDLTTQGQIMNVAGDYIDMDMIAAVELAEAAELAEDAEIAEAVLKANKSWNFYYFPESSHTERIEIRVCFPEDLVSVHYLGEEESKEPRKGPWEQDAADRKRFEDRIQKTAKALDPILTNSHRDKMFHMLHE